VLAALVGWLDRRQQEAVTYLIEDITGSNSFQKNSPFACTGQIAGRSYSLTGLRSAVTS